MSDPLSIAAGVVGLLQVTFSVAAELKRFHDGVKVVYDTISSLQHEVDTLSRVLTSARATFEAITAECGTGLVASHWRNIADLIETNKGILSQFLDELVAINKTSDLLDQARKQLRVRFAETKIANLRVLVQSFHSSLSVSLQCIILWNQVSLQKTMEIAIPNLSELQKDVRRIALKLNDRHDTHAKEPEQIRAFDQMRKCVRTAASVLSSASTVVEGPERNDPAKSDCGTAAGSDFHDCFPTEHKISIHRYMISRCSYEDRVAEYTKPAYFAKHHAHDLAEEPSDSEADEDCEVAISLLEGGKRLLSHGDAKGAEKKLCSCLSRLSASQWKTRSSEAPLTTKIDAMDSLVVIFTQQQRWADCKEIILAKLGLGDEFGYQHKAERAQDLFQLAQVLRADGSYDEARSYARKALKGYKDLRDKIKAADCIDLLAEIVYDEEHADELSCAESLPTPVYDGKTEDMKTLGANMNQMSLTPGLPLSPPETPDEQVRGQSPCRPVLFRNPAYGAKERPLTPTSPCVLPDPPPEIVVTPMDEEDEPLLTIDTHTSVATSITLSPSSSAGRRRSDESTNDRDEDFASRSGDETDKSNRTSRRRSITSSLRTKSPKAKAASRVKIVAVGDGASDIPGLFSRLWQHVGRGSLSSSQIRSDGLFHELDVDGKLVEMELVHMEEQNTLDAGPESPASEANAILACFSVGRPDSLRMTQAKWAPTLHRSSRGAPIILVGTQQELREDLDTVQMLASQLQHPVTHLEGQDIARKVGAHSYMECSAKTGDGVRKIFEQASRIGAMHLKKTKSRWKLFS